MNIAHAINLSEPEHRVAIHTAWRNSDGTMQGMRSELESMRWECPELDVDSIMDLCGEHAANMLA